MNVRNDPPGVPTPAPLGRNDVLRYCSGDTMRVRMRIYLPSGLPATPDNSVVDAVLVNQLFDARADSLWIGAWDAGVLQVDSVNHPGLVDITIPHTVSDELRRGQYMLGVRTTTSRGAHETVATPAVHILVDYSPVGSTHNIPYKD